MLTVRSTPISCGAQTLHGVNGMTLGELKVMLKPEYIPWVRRGFHTTRVHTVIVHPTDARSWCADLNKQMDGWIRETAQRIYKGETIIFSDIAGASNGGSKLQAWIKKYELGEVVSITTTNPNTQNNITTCIWVYNGNTIK